MKPKKPDFYEGQRVQHLSHEWGPRPATVLRVAYYIKDATWKVKIQVEGQKTSWVKMERIGSLP